MHRSASGSEVRRASLAVAEAACDHARLEALGAKGHPVLVAGQRKAEGAVYGPALLDHHRPAVVEVRGVLLCEGLIVVESEPDDLTLGGRIVALPYEDVLPGDPLLIPVGVGHQPKGTWIAPKRCPHHLMGRGAEGACANLPVGKLKAAVADHDGWQRQCKRRRHHRARHQRDEARCDTGAHHSASLHGLHPKPPALVAIRSIAGRA